MTTDGDIELLECVLTMHISRDIQPIITKTKMVGNKQELPKPVFTTPVAECPEGVTKDDMFIKTFKEAVEGGIRSAEAEMNTP